jgi:hypothetical protein
MVIHMRLESAFLHLKLVNPLQSTNLLHSKLAILLHPELALLLRFMVIHTALLHSQLVLLLHLTATHTALLQCQAVLHLHFMGTHMLLLHADLRLTDLHLQPPIVHLPELIQIVLPNTSHPLVKQLRDQPSSSLAPMQVRRIQVLFLAAIVESLIRNGPRDILQLRCALQYLLKPHMLITWPSKQVIAT